MGVIGINDIRNGMAVEMNNRLYWVIKAEHVKPGKGTAFCRTRLKDVESGKVVMETFKTSDKLNEVRLETKQCQYLYSDEHNAHFMNMDSYEQVALAEDTLEEEKKFLIPDMMVELLMHEERTVGIKLPNFVELRIVETEPAVRGDTVSGATKVAKLETGYTITIPLFISQDEVVRIDTRTGEYLERVK